jgi:hypothetical protein
MKVLIGKTSRSIPYPDSRDVIREVGILEKIRLCVMLAGGGEGSGGETIETSRDAGSMLHIKREKKSIGGNKNDRQRIS